MATTPDFLDDDHRTQAAVDEVFRPAPASRRSEGMAWAVAIGFALLALVGTWRGTGSVAYSGELAAFFGFASLWITFGNWIDRQTAIEVSRAGVRYRSPLRAVSLDWDEVDKLWALPSGSGWRIVVRGHGVRFGFRTSSELRVGKRSLKVGYPDGERLASMIRYRSRLSRPVGSEGEWICTRQAGVSE